MTDEAAAASETAETQDSPGTEDQGTSPDETAASGEETQAETTEETSTGEETQEEGAPAGGRSTALQKLLDKYGGDEDALVNAYFEQANSASRLSQEFEELRDYLMSGDDDEEDSEALVAEDPEFKGLGQELASLQQDIEAVQQDQMQLVGSYGQIENDVKALEAQMDKAEDFEKAALRTEINSKKAEMRSIMSQVNRGRRELNAINREIAGVERQQQQARDAVLGRREQQRKQDLQSAQVARLTREEFNTSMRTEAEGFGIDPGSKQFQVLSTAVRNQLANHLKSLPPDAPGIDIGAAVKHLMGEFGDAMGLKSRFTKRTQQAQGRTPVTSGPKGGTGTPPLPKGVKEPQMPKGMEQFGKDGNFTLEFSKERARRMLGD